MSARGVIKRRINKRKDKIRERATTSYGNFRYAALAFLRVADMIEDGTELAIENLVSAANMSKSKQLSIRFDIVDKIQAIIRQLPKGMPSPAFKRSIDLLMSGLHQQVRVGDNLCSTLLLQIERAVKILEAINTVMKEPGFVLLATIAAGSSTGAASAAVPGSGVAATGATGSALTAMRLQIPITLQMMKVRRAIWRRVCARISQMRQESGKPLE